MHLKKRKIIRFFLNFSRPVKIIRLIGRDTIEEIIYRRAASKLRLTNAIVEGGQFALGVPKPQGAAELQVKYSYILNLTPVMFLAMSPTEYFCIYV